MAVLAKFPLLFTERFATQSAHAEPAQDFTRMLEAATYSGRIESSVRALVANSVRGILTAVHFKPGDTVEKGQVLFEIGPLAYEQKLAANRAVENQRLVELGSAEAEALRVAELGARAAVSDQVAQDASDRLALAKVALEEAQANRALAELELASTKIRAPISGKIGLSNKFVGTYLDTENGQALAQIEHTDTVRVVYGMPYKTLIALDRSSPEGLDALMQSFQVDLYLPGNDQPLAKGGRLLFSESALVADETLRVWAEIPNFERGLIPGLHVDVKVTLPN
ncbi:efflux RND transporter periplasmic adaptor subunit [Shimia sp. Alg240-R146]|uniref:efflux RND transporter periplasmic adaptor subunit n=1 Tax=Shimia sp. Alg240-R146 TaxID=2993449 RepID=UPI000D54B5F6|nr:efflux RND transporter periplasmic adaptor subunit [Shimia sp. Alg240-R146]